MVMVLLAQVAVTPVGKPLTVPLPVAPVVVWIMLPPEVLLKAVFTHNVRSGPVEVTVLILTVIVPVAFTVPQPPVKGTL